MSKLMRVFTMALTAAIVACGDDEPAGPLPDQPIPGTYDLIRVDGARLPYTTTMQDVKVTLKSGVLVLEEDNTFTLTADAVATVFGMTGDYPVYNAGTYTRVDNTVTFALTIEGTGYEATGEARGGILNLTTSDPASPVRSMTLRRRAG